MTYSDFIEIVVGELRDSSDVRSRIDEWTNSTIKNVYRSIKPWLAKKVYERDIINGTRSYVIPPLISTNALFYYLTSDSESWKELKTTSDRMPIVRYAPTDIGAPQMVVVQKSSIDVYPLCDQTYKLRIVGFFYAPTLATISASKQESDLISEFPDLVRHGVLDRGFRYLQEYDFAKDEQAEYKECLKDLRAQNVRRVLSGEIKLWPSQHASGLENR